MTTKQAAAAIDKIERTARFWAEHMSDRYADLDTALLEAFELASRDDKLAFVYAAINAREALLARDEQELTAALAAEFGMQALESST